MNRLFYGDNLPVLRGLVASESVEVVYLEPPSNSQSSRFGYAGRCLAGRHTGIGFTRTPLRSADTSI